MKNFQLLFSDIKGFLSDELGRLFVCFIILNLGLGLWIHNEINQLNKNNIERYKTLENEINKVNKKVDYRYFNTTRSLEEINNVNIDTKNGELKR
jgi:hypothetical protein